MSYRACRSIALTFAVAAGVGTMGGMSWPAHADDADNAAPVSTSTETEDPFESINRVTSGFNRYLRGLVIDPLVDGYKTVTPEPVQGAVANAVSNLSEPVTAISSMLQGDSENAGKATRRFIVNTTVGIGGLGDPATDMGITSRREDVGQAFGAQGAAPGAHLVLPLLGPTNMRDLTGDALTAIANPLPLVATAAGGAVSYSKNKDDINAVGGAALDPYVAEREAYEQNRRYQVLNGDVPTQAFPSFADGDAAEGSAANIAKEPAKLTQ